MVATLLRNFASYAAALAGYTAAVIASDQLGAVGGLDGQAFPLAITRATEICIGIVCAGAVLAGTDFGGVRRQLAQRFAELGTEIAHRFVETLALGGTDFAKTQALRRDFVGRVIALDPVIDQSLGESSQLRYYSPVLQRAVDGLFAASAAWRDAAVLLARLPRSRATDEAAAVLAHVSEPLRLSPDPVEAARWVGEPEKIRATCDAARQTLRALPAKSPAARLLADQTAALFGGVSRALDGLVVLVAHSPRSMRVALDKIPDGVRLVAGQTATVQIDRR